MNSSGSSNSAIELQCVKCGLKMSGGTWVAGTGPLCVFCYTSLLPASVIHVGTPDPSLPQTVNTGQPHWFGPSGKTSKGKGHPVMYSFKEAEMFEPFPEGGGYPKGFLKRAFDTLGVDDPEKVLHLCSGSMKSGITVDIRPEKNPKIVADCRKVPLPDDSVDWIMADPPYAESYAENLYGTGKDYPQPGEILKEAGRLLKMGGRVGLLHFVVPVVRKNWGLGERKVYCITTGAGYAVRAWSVFTKIAPFTATHR